LGTLLYVYYQVYPKTLPADIGADHVFPYFIVHEVPVGLRGFLIAGAFSAAMSTLSSALNSLANVTVVDFLDRFRPGNTVRRAKTMTVIWATIVILAGLQAANFKSILKLGLLVNSYFYGCLLGVFLLGMTTKCATSIGAFLGLTSSLIAILACGFFIPDYAIWFGAVGCLVCMGVGYVASFLPFDRKQLDAHQAAPGD
jgi:solute:Na+ symporter, SSS family